ncbi:acyltransferase 3 [Xylariomycetidae sp. FL2044]|nr:acyltransferase 3 [Xylariomycetidae sp. FL2044]
MLDTVTIPWSPLEEKPRPTAYLDGLRGLAALIVCICHYTENNHRYLTPTYGLYLPGTHDEADGIPSSPIQLPFIRIIFSGRPMVHIFFVVSGFALSYRPLREIRARRFAGFHAALSSSVFRRPMRLLGPPIVSMACILALVRCGLMPRFFRESLAEQLRDWCDAVYYHVTWPWGWNDALDPRYDIHLWTIPIELCHSMLLFLFLLGISRLRTRARVLATTAFVVYCMHCGRWAAFEFIAGVVLAEWQLWSAEQATAFSLPPGLQRSAKPKAGFWKRCLEPQTFLHSSIIFLTWYIAGWPNENSINTPFIRYLASHTPATFPGDRDDGPQKFWFALCAVAVVWTAGRAALFRALLESRFAQYAGRVSFAVYIVHGPVLDICQGLILGSASYYNGDEYNAGTKLRGIFGIDTMAGRTICWGLGLVLLAVPVMIAAHLFCRFVDEPIVRLAKCFEKWCLVADVPHRDEG